MSKHYPGGYDPTKVYSRYPSPKETVEKQLYPRTKKEEFVYWVDLVFATLGTAIWVFPFALIAFYAR